MYLAIPKVSLPEKSLGPKLRRRWMPAKQKVLKSRSRIKSHETRSSAFFLRSDIAKEKNLSTTVSGSHGRNNPLSMLQHNIFG